MNQNEDNLPKKTEKSSIAKNEEKILKFWQENKIFEKSVEKDAPNGDYVFYDGPPFATGTPHFGNLLPGTVKDVIPRFKTMNGYRVKRRWGWDTHGLPIENLIEKELGLDTKKDIEAYGIDKFNKRARDTVFRYADIWKEIIPRTGRFVDMENSYNTMSPKYTESVWWMFKELHQKDLLSEGFKSMHLCPRCETTLSNFEVNQEYKDITDISVYAKFELEDEPGTFLVAWTTTPWTLPGNVALAVNPDATYVKVLHEENNYIVAKNLVEKVFEGKEFAEGVELKSEDLVGRKYKPLFDYYTHDSNIENRENGWKIYSDDFVTLEEGVGIVHIAPAFGDEDYLLSKRENLPFVQHVNKNGTFRDEVHDFAGLKVKPKGDGPNDHQTTDIEIIKHLAHAGKLFAKKKIVHSYPHCWRCKTPLLNFASSSWFINVPKIKDKLVEENEKIKWVPENIGKNRFGNWLKDAREWAISRSRFWGAPIPVWKSEDGIEVAILGSLEDLQNKTRGNNKYILMRHGEADHNVNQMISDSDEHPSNLTKKGIEDVENMAKKLCGRNIDFILVSPIHRTRATATIVAEEFGMSPDKIIIDDRITESRTGTFGGKTQDEYHGYFKTLEDKFYKKVEGGETLIDVKNRVGDFIYEMDQKYDGKTILIITHEYPIWMFETLRQGFDVKDSISIKDGNIDFINPGEILEYNFASIPHNENYELDFHRPYIDEITFVQNGKKMKRVEDVFDVWIDSGSVPFASTHYPFEKSVDPKGGFFKKTKGYPADFIAEGLDQTRGWFYTMLVLNTALFGKAPYKNVIVNGLILAEDGRKMSKSLNNYPEIDTVLDKYGADAFRYFLMSSPAVRAEDFSFSEKGVDEVLKKLIMRLQNVTSFYEMYADGDVVADSGSSNALDQWIISRLGELHADVTNGLENLEIDRAARPIMDFVDDLSTWYIRRSRDRFKGDLAVVSEQNKDNVVFANARTSSTDDRQQALQTTKFVLLELTKLIAPFMPFIADDIYLRLGENKESVHLENWTPKISANKKVLEDMKVARDLVTQILEVRTNVGIKVRQPLASASIKSVELSDGLVEILKDEVNVKKVVFDMEQKDKIFLDTEISGDLQREGDARELIRFIQNLRKNMGLKASDKITLQISQSAKDITDAFADDFERVAGASQIVHGNFDGEAVNLARGEVVVSVRVG